MYQIVYVSTATREYDRDELERILAVSRKNNSLDGVTGMLCYHGGTFFQMLEGERDKVEAVMKRVAQDKRHYGVMVLLEQEVESRDLPDWSMAFNQVSRREAQALDGFSELLKSGHDQRLGDGGAVTSDALDLIAGFRDTVLPGSRMTF
ncbi:MAG: BLUF domain-containing protein [Alcanivoracaceae bacterium]|nr:BLUF domain-containing protein [Alcanivoracaceae bacterium]